MAGKDFHKGLPWYEWEDSLKDPDAREREKWCTILENEVDYYQFVQFLFFSQWYDLKEYANKKGIRLIRRSSHLCVYGQRGCMGTSGIIPAG